MGFTLATFFEDICFVIGTTFADRTQTALTDVFDSKYRKLFKADAALFVFASCYFLHLT